MDSYTMNTPVKDKNRIKTILLNIPKEKFELQKVLGHDYFNGVVVVKNNKLAGRIENIKFLESIEPNLREQFLKEGKVLSAIQHKNIPRIYDILEYEDFLIFRSEHVEGYSLMEVLEALKKRKKEFPKFVAASIILKLMNALYYTHNDVKYDGKKKSIIHCDIKPSNIILSAKDYRIKNGVDNEFLELVMQNKIEPYIIDFGIAKFKGEAKRREGTVNYLSPEQLTDNSSKIDWRSDMHQLLLVYHEMLTKKKPYSNIAKNKIIAYKLAHDFKADKRISSITREIIEIGTRKDSSKSFKTEKECIKSIAKIESRQKTIHAAKQYKKPAFASLFIILLMFGIYYAAIIWDEKIKSTDAIISKFEKISNPTPAELSLTVQKLQKRAFEKKYYQPLIKGEFRDKKTGNPMYPSHLNVNGEWILAGPETEEAGVFAGLLFTYSNRYPDLIEYAKEYSEPILNSEFDGTAGKRYMYALIPAYDKTGDKRYLTKLVNVSDNLIYYFKGQAGMTQCDDLYYTDLFLYVYNETGNRKYLEFYDNYVHTFIKDNIDKDGYVYMFASINATSPYGLVPDSKANWVIIATGDYPAGTPMELSDANQAAFKSIAGMYTRDFIEVITSLDKMYTLTKNFEYEDALITEISYYLNNSELINNDYLFVSSAKEKYEIPKDSLSSMKSIILFQKYNETIYYNKLKNFVSFENFESEKNPGIIKGNVYIDNLNYDDVNANKKNQTLILTDALFLEMTVNN
jgi:serine/threonine protein kinase